VLGRGNYSEEHTSIAIEFDVESFWLDHNVLLFRSLGILIFES
jgi:hypothetical protein